VLKVSLVFNSIVALIFVLGSWVTWSMALRRGIPDRVVDIFESLTLTLTIEGELYFRIIVLLAIIGAILMTAFMTLGAVLYNLIADLVGGIEIAVLEETYKPVATRTRISSVSEPEPVEASWTGSPGVPEPPEISDPVPIPFEEPGVVPVAPAAAVATPDGEARREIEVEVEVARPDQSPDGEARSVDAGEGTMTVSDDEVSRLRTG
jgi:hypothetical protein